MSMPMPRYCVIDASALIKYVYHERETPLVEQLIETLLIDDDARIYVPDLSFH